MPNPNDYFKKFSFLVLCLIMPTGYALEGLAHQEQMSFENINFKMQRASTQKDLTVIQSEAEFWKLSIEDYERYRTLIQSEGFKSWWKELNPPHVLGLMAKQQSELQKYAEIEVQIDFDRAGRELAFQKAYTAAFQKYYPQSSPIGENQAFSNKGAY